jgi:hypothetical protein
MVDLKEITCPEKKRAEEPSTSYRTFSHGYCLRQDKLFFFQVLGTEEKQRDRQQDDCSLLTYLMIF